MLLPISDQLRPYFASFSRNNA